MNALALSVGPFALPTQAVLLAVCVLVAAGTGFLASRRQQVGLGSTLLDMLFAAVVAARIAFVSIWFDAYRAQPWSMLDVRDGGFTPWAGAVAAALVAVWRCRRTPALRKPLALGLVAGALGWMSIPGALRFGDDPTLADFDAIALSTASGGSVRLDALAAHRPIVVNLWATWCPPCRREMPVLADAQQRLPEVAFAFVNQGEDASTVERFLKETRLVLDNLLLDRNKSVGMKYGSMALPITLFYDADGKLVDKHLGALSAGSLASKLARLGGPVASVPVSNPPTPRR